MRVNYESVCSVATISTSDWENKNVPQLGTVTTSATEWTTSASCTLSSYNHALSSWPAGADASYLSYFTMTVSGGSIIFTANPLLATIAGDYQIEVTNYLIEEPTNTVT